MSAFIMQYGVDAIYLDNLRRNHSHNQHFGFFMYLSTPGAKQDILLITHWVISRCRRKARCERSRSKHSARPVGCWFNPNKMGYSRRSSGSRVFQIFGSYGILWLWWRNGFNASRSLERARCGGSMHLPFS